VSDPFGTVSLPLYRCSGWSTRTDPAKIEPSISVLPSATIVALSQSLRLLSAPMPPTPGSAFTLSAVIGAMRDSLKLLSREERIDFPALMTSTVKELASVGLVVEPADDSRAAWERLRDKHPLAFLLIEAYSQVETLGYIVHWPNTPQPPHPNWFRLTERGKQWVSSAGPALEDSDGFLAALNGLIPTLDTVVKQYIAEAVVTYSRQAWFAAAVMVGAASEKLVYMLADSLLVITGGSNHRSLEKTIKERNLPNLFEHLSKVLTGHIESGDLPYDIHEGSEPHLMSLFEAIRVQRNDAVHPTVGEVTPATVRLTLSAFPAACRKVYDLIDWCQRH
jgi:hypothetical protein